MRPGGGKEKGGQFEREVCVALSLMLSGGKQRDLFWRSAMSGGRATISHGKIRQPGDITAVHTAGAPLTDRYVIECKHTRDLHLLDFLLQGEGGRDSIKAYWKKLCKEAIQHHKWPMLIAKQNRLPIIVVLRDGDPLSQNFYLHHHADHYVIGLYADMLKLSKRYWPW